MVDIDFVIPVKYNNFLIRTVIECVNSFYKPRNIYIITSIIFIDEIAADCKEWYTADNIVFLDEDVFFMKNYNLLKSDIEKMYVYKDEDSREFGWWYQQLLKLGSVYQIETLSDPYVVWDSDLVSLKKWEIESQEGSEYKFAILQEKSKNEWNKQQYAASIRDLIDMEAIDPDSGGTFVPHHFVFHHCVIKTLLRYIVIDIDSQNWIERIMGLSHKYYRFSEYKCVATFMRRFYPELLVYHDFEMYGKTGIRYRESEEIVKQIKGQCILPAVGMSYVDFCKFVENNFPEMPSYVQIEHLVCTSEDLHP
jgi:hypothetical protein